LEQSGADTLLKFDADGSGGMAQSALTIAVLKGVTKTAITVDNFTPSYPPDGSALPGQLITGLEAAESIAGTAGSDTIKGLGGADTIDGLSGNDSLEGGAGNDSVDGNFGNDTLLGGDGNDTLKDDQGVNYLDGGAGDDMLQSRSLTGGGTLLGGLGNDSLTGVGQKLSMVGGEGTDSLTVSGEIQTSGNSASYVKNGEAALSGDAGDDSLSANYMWSVQLQGGEGRDNLSVSATIAATLEGGAGNDTLTSQYSGGTFQDKISDTKGSSYKLDGGAGDDTLSGSGWAENWAGDVVITMEGGAGNDSLSLKDSSITMNNGSVKSASLSGGEGDDKIVAYGVRRLTISGGLGVDTIELNTWQYKTILTLGGSAGTGSTVPGGMSGGGTSDNAQAVEITDFVAGKGGDVLDVKDLMQNAATSYDGTNPFATGHLKLEQSGADTLLKFDADGSGGTAQTALTIAVLKGVDASRITSSNFYPMFGTPNNDVLDGTPASEKIYGIGGNDSLDGGGGDDTVDGGDGNDYVEGGAGDDEVIGGAGSDTLDGGEGEDCAEYADQIIGIFLSLVDGMAKGNESDVQLWTDKLIAIENACGGAGDDQIFGNAGSNKLGGREGNDTLNGGAGFDYVEYEEVKN
jgi:Ca2+-binding RTX toxin-like protein